MFKDKTKKHFTWSEFYHSMYKGVFHDEMNFSMNNSFSNSTFFSLCCFFLISIAQNKRQTSIIKSAPNEKRKSTRNVRNA